MADYSVEIDGRRVRLTHLDRVVYPATGTTKAQMVDYYRRVAPAILAHLRDRPVTRIRFPGGATGEPFFEKNLPAGAPAWLRRIQLPASPGGDRESTTAQHPPKLQYPLLDDLAGLVWAANQNALELHTPQWRVDAAGEPLQPDRLVVDLDPGEPAGLAECAQVAALVAERLAADGLTCVPVTSGGKGLHLYAPLDGHADSEIVRSYAHAIADELARAHPRLVVSVMRKELRRGKVLLDGSQNHPAKTTITPYSLRGLARPTVAAPRHWEEIGPDLAQLTLEEVAERYERDGDPAESAA